MDLIIGYSIFFIMVFGIYFLLEKIASKRKQFLAIDENGIKIQEYPKTKWEEVSEVCFNHIAVKGGTITILTIIFSYTDENNEVHKDAKAGVSIKYLDAYPSKLFHLLNDMKALKEVSARKKRMMRYSGKEGNILVYTGKE